jgi:hypothetical protein
MNIFAKEDMKSSNNRQEGIVKLMGSFALPYVCSFDTPSDLSYWTIADVDGYATWSYDYQNPGASGSIGALQVIAPTTE